jgi:hypothetical protein
MSNRKKDKQRSTKHTQKPKDREKWNPQQTGDELWCSRRISNSCSRCGTCLVTIWPYIINCIYKKIMQFKKYRIFNTDPLRFSITNHDIILFTFIEINVLASSGVMWSSLLVTCDRSVVFTGHSGFLHQ